MQFYAKLQILNSQALENLCATLFDEQSEVLELSRQRSPQYPLAHLHNAAGKICIYCHVFWPCQSSLLHLVFSLRLIGLLTVIIRQKNFLNDHYYAGLYSISSCNQRYWFRTSDRHRINHNETYSEVTYHCLLFSDGSQCLWP